MQPTQLEREHAGAVEDAHHEEDAVAAEEAEEAKVAKEDMGPRTMLREAWSRSLSPSRSPSSREEPINSRVRRHHRCHPHRTWPT
jgi:hypothetical protein